MKEYVPVAKDCEHCSKKRGSFGCCTTVSNNWVYSCAEGQKEWVLDKIIADIEEERKVENIPEDVNMYDYINALDRALSIIDWRKAESEE